MEKEKLETLKNISILIRTIIQQDLREDVTWLSHLRCSFGYLEDSIRQLEKEVKKEL